MSVRIEFDCWNRCYDGTAFILTLDAVPREGEIIHIHKDLLPLVYVNKSGGFENVDFDDSINGDGEMYAEFKVSTIHHVIDKDGQLVQCCIDFEF